MNHMPNPEMLDDENPEWTEDDFQNAIPFSGLPESLRAKLTSLSRGPQETSVHERVAVRLPHEEALAQANARIRSLVEERDNCLERAERAERELENAKVGLEALVSENVALRSILEEHADAGFLRADEKGRGKKQSNG